MGIWMATGTLSAGRGCSNPHPSGHSQTRTRTRDPPRVTNCARARDPRVPYTRGHARLLAKICWEQIRRGASRGGRPRIGGSSSSRCGAAAGPSGSRRGATAAGGCGSVAAQAPGEARRPAAARSPSGRPLGLQAGRDDGGRPRRDGCREAATRWPLGLQRSAAAPAPRFGRPPVGPLGWGGGGYEREARRGTGMEGMNENARTNYIVVYGVHVSVDFAGSRVRGHGYSFFEPTKFYPSGSSANPHPYPWVQIQTRILALASFCPRARG